MARDISVLLIGDSHMANRITPGDTQAPVEDNVNGYRTQLKDWLTNNGARSYSFIDGGRHTAGFYTYLRSRGTGGDWSNDVEPNVPVDLVVFDGDNGATISLNLADFFTLAQQNGDEIGQSARQLAFDLINFAGCNAVLFTQCCAPDAYTAAIASVPNGIALQNRIADLVGVLSDTVPGMVSSLDFRPVLSPVNDFFPLSISGGGDRASIWNAAGALAAAAAAGAHIEAIPRYLLQPDETGA